jgi:FAD/FMN-containing dehydrogenase
MTDDAPQKNLWEVRKAGLNIMMSLKGDGKPVSFIEDCAVPLEHLAEYTDALTQVFRKHGSRGTWYAHASVGTLHVRPILDMRRDGPRARKMRAIAEEASALVRKYKGAYSGEHGDGLCRGEWIQWQFGPRSPRPLARSSSSSTRRPAEPAAHRQPAAHGRHAADAFSAQRTASFRSRRRWTGAPGTCRTIR